VVTRTSNIFSNIYFCGKLYEDILPLLDIGI
jgi:hypothetical protein